MAGILDILNKVPSGLWAFVGVAVGLWVNGRKEKRAALEREAMRKEERAEREALRNEERLTAWRTERIYAHTRMMSTVRKALAVVDQYISEKLPQAEAAQQMDRVIEDLEEQFSELELVATQQVAQAGVKCVEQAYLSRSFLGSYEGPPEPYSDAGENDRRAELGESLDFWHDSHQVRGELRQCYEELVTAAREAQGLAPIEYRRNGL